MQQRTHTCGELTEKNIDEVVSLCGWVHTRRDHGGLIFIDLWDKYGLTQVVLNPRLTNWPTKKRIHYVEIL